MALVFKIICVVGFLVGLVGSIVEKDKYVKEDMEHMCIISLFAMIPVFFLL